MKAPEVLTVRALNRATLARQMLLTREDIPPLAAVERLCALQAQWPKVPYVGLWSRLAQFRREELSELARRREVVRGTMMRGTLHLLSARDYLRMRTTMQRMLTRGMASILKKRTDSFDVDGMVGEARRYFGKEPRTFDEVRDHLVGCFPDGDERAMGYAARMNLPLIQVPTDADWGWPSVAQFALADSWLGEPVSDQEDQASIVLRYLAALGPATVADAQNWTGLKGLAPVFESLRPGLVTFRDERKRELFDLPDSPRPPEDTVAPVRFLSEFDNVLLGHDDRTRIIAEENKSSVYLPGLRVASTIIVDGFVAGVWKAERKGKKATLVVEPFVKLTKKIRAELADEGERLAGFVEPEATILDLRLEDS